MNISYHKKRKKCPKKCKIKISKLNSLLHSLNLLLKAMFYNKLNKCVLLQIHNPDWTLTLYDYKFNY